MNKWRRQQTSNYDRDKVGTNRPICNISFVVIARNEEFAIEKCLNALHHMRLENCQVICIDSDSSDNTVAIMKQYSAVLSNVGVYKISGTLNAAIARNIGLQYASKKYIFFVDGDVALDCGFVARALRLLDDSEVLGVAGNLNELTYSHDYSTVVKEQIRNSVQCKSRRIEEVITTGGIFITRRCVVDIVGKYDEQYIIHEDWDYSARISRNGKLLFVPETMGTHHTLPATRKEFQHLLNGTNLCSGRILRKSIRNDRRLFMHLLSHNFRGAVAIGCMNAFLVLIFVAFWMINSPAVISGLLALYILFLGILIVIKRKRLREMFVVNNITLAGMLFGCFVSKKVDGATGEEPQC